MKKLTHSELIFLVAENALKSVLITADSGGFYLTFEFSESKRTLHTQRGSIRYFTYIDTCLSYLFSLGISEARITFNKLISTSRLFS